MMSFLSSSLLHFWSESLAAVSSAETTFGAAVDWSTRTGSGEDSVSISLALSFCGANLTVLDSFAFKKLLLSRSSVSAGESLFSSPNVSRYLSWFCETWDTVEGSSRLNPASWALWKIRLFSSWEYDWPILIHPEPFGIQLWFRFWQPWP